uniref:Uncharacterized protein n=1 Tax=Ciona intestinalis TaxID=7719 RepID=F7AXS8_CIOIN
MASDRLPVVSLNESSLRRLQQKLQKMKESEKLDEAITPSPTTDKKPRQRKPTRSPKYEVYKPGVTRLSNRRENPSTENAQSFHKTQKDLKSAGREVSASGDKKKVNEDRKPTSDRRRRREGKRRDANHRSRKSPEENSDESSDMEEGYLARHHRRMGNTRHLSSTSNDGAGEKTDELEWDNYNHSRLFEPWSEMDQQCDDQQQHEPHTETTGEIFVEEKPKPQNRKQV